ncbi:hypothetical protein L596_012829 [Steinernema carpocapsae]|uniref:PHD finger protein 10 n=1 Tax=Steinernema carpocapsae TaxID=34508 RepID=A0A4U5NY93_STECR|nr:hypothetical protein L596_012829 [Steinernema carpocapsae]
MADVEAAAPAPSGPEPMEMEDASSKEESTSMPAPPVPATVSDDQQASSSSVDAPVEAKEEDTMSSTADSEGSKTKTSRALAVDVTHFQIEPNHIIEYEWPDRSGERYFLQEQIAELLDVKSFKRKYSSMSRRPVEADERDYLESVHKLNASLPSHLLSNITALKAAEVHDLMAVEYPEQYQKYQKVVVERRRREQRNALTNKVDKRPLAERMKEAVQEAASYNREFNSLRAPGYMDIQTMICQYPRNKFYVLPKEKTKPSAYPCALIHGQFSEYYKKFTPNQMRKFPLGTVLDSTDLFPVRREPSPPGVSVSETEQAVLDAAAAAEAEAEAEANDSGSEVRKEKLEPATPKVQATPRGRKPANLAAEDEATPVRSRKRPAPASTGRKLKRVKKEESDDEEEVSDDEDEPQGKVTASGRRPLRTIQRETKSAVKPSRKKEDSSENDVRRSSRRLAAKGSRRFYED